MRILIIYVTLIFLNSALANAESPELGKIKITIHNKTSEFNVVPLVENIALIPKYFTAIDDSKFEIEVPIQQDKWYTNVRIKLIWRDVEVRSNGQRAHFEQRILVRFRSYLPQNYTISVFYSNNRTEDEMKRLELLNNFTDKNDLTDKYEVYFRGGQIAKFYREYAGPSHRRTRRAVKMFFLAAKELAEQSDNVVMMSDEAEKLASTVFTDLSEASYYKNHILNAKSVYWYDLKKLDALVSSGKCEAARILIQNFSEMRESDPDTFLVRYGESPNIINEKMKICNQACGFAQTN